MYICSTLHIKANLKHSKAFSIYFQSQIGVNGKTLLSLTNTVSDTGIKEHALANSVVHFFRYLFIVAVHLFRR